LRRRRRRRRASPHGARLFVVVRAVCETRIRRSQGALLDAEYTIPRQRTIVAERGTPKGEERLGFFFWLVDRRLVAPTKSDVGDARRRAFSFVRDALRVWFNAF
jgi:hypothetical protein